MNYYTQDRDSDFKPQSLAACTDPVKLAALDPRPLDLLVQIAREGVAMIREKNNLLPRAHRIYPDDALTLAQPAPRTYPKGWA